MMPFPPFFFHLYYVIVMPEPLNLLDNDSHIEKCWLLFLLFISFHLYRRSNVGPIRNHSIISLSAIQYRCIYTNIYYTRPSSFLSLFSCNLKYSNGRFFFFRLIFYFSDWKQRNLSLWSGLHLSGLHPSLFLFSFFYFFKADPLEHN